MAKTVEEEVVHEEDIESRIYEVGYHIIPTVAEENAPGIATELKFLIEKHKGMIISEELPRLRLLAYTIDKMVDGKKLVADRAYFGWIKFEIPTGDIGAIKEGIETNKNILRFLLIKTVRESTLAPAQKIMMAPARTEKDKPVDMAKPAEVKEKKPVSVEELDKTIDELLA